MRTMRPKQSDIDRGLEPDFPITVAAAFNGREFPVSHVGYFNISVVDLTAGIITIQYSYDGGTNWESIDDTNLKFDYSVASQQDWTRVAMWGGCLVRAIGDSSVKVKDVFIEGRYVGEARSELKF